MNGIKMVRVDFRLIHGQVITKWKNKIDAKEIIVVNDQLANDEFMADIYIMAAPPGIKVHVVTVDQFVSDSTKGKFESGSILVLFKNIEDVKSTVEKGIKFQSVQIGGLGSGNGRTSVVKGVSIDKVDASNLKYIEESGAEITFQVTPEEPKLSLDKAIKKIGG